MPAPDGDLDLSTFPATFLRRGSFVYRGHSPEADPWQYTTGAGRLDLERPLGACYMYRDAGSAAEALLTPAAAGLHFVTETQANAFIVSRRTIRRGQRLASAAALRARDYGVQREMPAQGTFEVTQQWAAAFQRAGFDGIVYALTRQSPRGQAIVLFGPAGTAPPLSHPATLSGREAAEAGGFQVIPHLTRSHLTLI